MKDMALDKAATVPGSERQGEVKQEEHAALSQNERLPKEKEAGSVLPQIGDKVVEAGGVASGADPDTPSEEVAPPWPRNSSLDSSGSSALSWRNATDDQLLSGTLKHINLLVNRLKRPRDGEEAM